MSAPNDALGQGLEKVLSQIRSGELSATALVRASLARINALDGRYRCMVHLDEAGALERAAELDEHLKAGKPCLPLHGIPVVVKEIFSVNGMPHSSGSRLSTPELFSAEGGLIGRLRAAGCVIIGKSFSTEFAFAQCNLSKAMPLNPCDTEVDRATGGSSSGSAVAQALGYAGFSLGTDTGGSVRGPAALCGVTGYKPEEGAWPVDGMFSLSTQLDTPGIFAATMADLQLVVQVIECIAVAPLPAPGELRIGIAGPQFKKDLDSVVSVAWEVALDRLRSAGVQLMPVELPAVDEAERYFSSDLPKELLTKLGVARVADHIAELDPVTAARLRPFLDRSACDDDLNLADLRRAAARALTAADVVCWISPAVPCVAPALSEIAEVERILKWQAHASRNTRAVSLLGQAAISLPLRVGNRHPVGLQIAAAPGQSAAMLNIAVLLERLLALQ